MFWPIILVAFCLTAGAQRVCNTSSTTDESNRFYFPAPVCLWKNYSGINSYTLGTKLSVTWTTTEPLVDLAIWQEGNNDGLGKLRTNISSGTTSYDFSGYPPQSISSGNTFFFVMYKSGDTSWLFASDYFNLSDPSAASSATSTRTGTSLPTSTSSATTSPAAATTSPAASNSSSGGDGKYIGIGVGVGVGGALLIGAGLVWFFMRRRKNAKQRAGGSYQTPATLGQNDKMLASSYSSPMPKQEYYGSQQQYQPSYSSPPQEMYQPHSSPPPAFPSELEHPSTHYNA